MTRPVDPRIQESFELVERARRASEQAGESGDGLLATLSHRLYNMTAIYDSERERTWAAHKSIADGGAEAALYRLLESARAGTPEHLHDAAREDHEIVYQALVGLRQLEVTE